MGIKCGHDLGGEGEEKEEEYAYIYIYIRRGECGGGLAGYVETQAIKKI